ncbi:MAG: double zinc ribbon domain-containing protein [Gammaproteobacteria bacterium]|nr:double zinc ribbon domain-containing protein [Gammaproteobacteria bacterium]
MQAVVMIRLAHALSFALIPGTCVLCEARTARRLDLCLACERDLPVISRRCRFCSLPVVESDVCAACATSPPIFDAAFCCYHYQTPIDRMVSDFKDHGRLTTGFVLTEITASRFIEARAPGDPDALLPVPLHRSKRRQRGFNQAEEIAFRLGQRLRIPVLTRALRVTRPLESQRSLGRRERAGNLRGAFARRAVDRAGFMSRSSMTSSPPGSTAGAIAQVLKAAGASRVDIIALARTPSKVTRRSLASVCCDKVTVVDWEYINLREHFLPGHQTRWRKRSELSRRHLRRRNPVYRR